ncbi:hypothetical protein SDC9_207360 [bioreactor metagenome]|uniref:Uncharacterized protein n=1 Tax=bioreactor metagenome TaxID=1076179 RepID=A0A645JA83_9ZZZZ
MLNVLIIMKEATPQTAESTAPVALALLQYNPNRIGQKNAHSNPPIANKLIHTIKSGG